MKLRREDIPDSQIRQAALHCSQALRELRDEGIGRWWEDEYREGIDDSLFFGRYWRRVAKIHSMNDAKRELTYVAERIEQAHKPLKLKG